MYDYDTTGHLSNSILQRSTHPTLTLHSPLSTPHLSALLYGFLLLCCLTLPCSPSYPSTMSSFRVVVLVACLLLALFSVQAVDYSKYNARTGKKFLDENKDKEGVTTTASGLQYKVLETGSGTRSPGPSEQVKVHYRGTLLNGKEFDSSYSRGTPATFGVGQVIKGWTEALQLMHEGDVWELYIPSELAYGERGTGADIGPNSTLVFKVELIEILAGGAPAGGPARKAKKPKDLPDITSQIKFQGADEL